MYKIPKKPKKRTYYVFGFSIRCLGIRKKNNLHTVLYKIFKCLYRFFSSFKIGNSLLVKQFCFLCKWTTRARVLPIWKFEFWLIVRKLSADEEWAVTIKLYNSLFWYSVEKSVQLLRKKSYLIQIFLLTKAINEFFPCWIKFKIAKFCTKCQNASKLCPSN